MLLLKVAQSKLFFILPNESGKSSEAKPRLKKCFSLFYQGQHVISSELTAIPDFITKM